jgi:hypothetical protein
MAGRVDYFKNLKERANQVASDRTIARPIQPRPVPLQPSQSNRFIQSPATGINATRSNLPTPAPQAMPAVKKRPLGNTVGSFNRMFSQSYFDPRGKDPRPTRQQRDQSSILRSALGYGGKMTLNDLVNLPQAQIEAAMEKARTSGPIKVDKGSPFADTKAGRKLKAQAAALKNLKKKKK